MISRTPPKTPPSECFVYITLPEQTEAVTAGRFQLTANRSGTPVGRFVYGRSYLDRREAVEIDPVELRLARGATYETTGLRGVFGALRDAGPDYWGRAVIERHVGKAPLSELDYFLESPDDRAGALGFGLGVEPPAPRRKFNQTIELEKLQKIADALIQDEEQKKPGDAGTAQVQELLFIGTSMGGARPKAVVEDKDGLWLAKFNTPHDRWNMARVEHAMLVLARACGLTIADSRVVDVGGRDVLLVKRFDRIKVKEGYLRGRMVSALTLLRADDIHNTRDSWSYVMLVEELRRVTADPKRNAHELFRRMVFNGLISNTDDHPRNHAALAMNNAWSLSPAYDLTPTSPVSVERRDLAMICGNAGRYANAANMLSQSARFLLAKDEAAAIVEEMKTNVRARWYAAARGQVVSERDCERISGAFAYEGFGLPLPREAG
jgi:serine/threonine-protein kinase HipA